MAGKRSTNNKLEKLRRKISLNSFPKKYEKRTSRLSWSGRNIEAEAEERERECNPMKSHSKRERVYLFSPPLPSLYRPALTRKIAHDFSRCRSSSKFLPFFFFFVDALLPWKVKEEGRQLILRKGLIVDFDRSQLRFPFFDLSISMIREEQRARIHNFDFIIL